MRITTSECSNFFSLLRSFVLTIFRLKYRNEYGIKYRLCVTPLGTLQNSVLTQALMRKALQLAQRR